ncbi:MAG TPA: hypothetical protein VG435_05095 [Acidimicrobiales bacterium]|nr:hypothetical protein [Acidimicrobiales bacterium]
MSYSSAPFDDADGELFTCPTSHWELALQATSRLAVVFALSLALILILGHR